MTLIAFFAANFVAASSGAIFKPGAWYLGLKKPVWTPPNFAFPLVWSALYSANAVSGWLVFEAAGWGAGPALSLYGASLLLNAGWSAVFFGAKRLDWGMAEVVLLWLSIAAVLLAFAPFSALAAWLQVPYLAWVTVAALNLRLLQMNGPRGERAAVPA